MDISNNNISETQYNNQLINNDSSDASTNEGASFEFLEPIKISPSCRKIWTYTMKKMPPKIELIFIQKKRERKVKRKPTAYTASNYLKTIQIWVFWGVF